MRNMVYGVNKHSEDLSQVRWLTLSCLNLRGSHCTQVFVWELEKINHLELGGVGRDWQDQEDWQVGGRWGGEGMPGPGMW